MSSPPCPRRERGPATGPSVSLGAGVHYDVYELTTASAATIRASLCAAGGGSANYDSVVAIYQAPGARNSRALCPTAAR
jgi:hypothetical protein